MGRFRELDQIQPPYAGFHCGYDGLEWPERRCHAESLDLELFHRHFHPSSQPQIMIFESSRLDLRTATSTNSSVPVT
jgi:hypothetical protein